MPSAVRPPEVDVEAPATLKGQWQAGAGTVPEFGVSACVYERTKINVVKNLKAFVRNGTFLKKCTILKMFVSVVEFHLMFLCAPCFKARSTSAT